VTKILFKKILAGTDFSPCSDKVLDDADKDRRAIWIEDPSDYV